MNTHELFLPSLFAAHTRRLQPLQQLLQLLIVQVLPALHCDRLQVLAKFHGERHGVPNFMVNLRRPLCAGGIIYSSVS